MTYRHVTFAVELGRPVDAIILGARAAVADVLRAEARAAVQRAGDAGVDPMTLGQRLVMSYVSAQRASRFLRGYPAAAARWCFMVEQHVGQLSSEGYPACPPMTVGSYGYDWLTLMPHGVALLNAGGIRATGVLPEGATIALHDVREIRVAKTVDLDNVTAYTCTVIMSSESGNRLASEDPVSDEPSPLEREDL